MKGYIKIGTLTFSTAARIANKLLVSYDYGHDKSMPEMHNQVKGIYSSRLFGLCIYRNSELD